MQRLTSRVLSVMFCAAALSACAPTLQTQKVSHEEMMSEASTQLKVSREVALKKMTSELAEQYSTVKKVMEIGGRILSTSAPLCGEMLTYDYTLMPWSTESFAAGTEREAAITALHVGPQPTIGMVFNGSPAAQAGLKEGDTLLKVGTHTVGKGKDALKNLQTYIAKQESLPTATPLSVVVARGDAVLSKSILPAQRCKYGLSLDNSDVPNAHADGQNIVINRGIVAMTESDSEIALVIGHELAHNVLDHVDKTRGNMLLGTLGGALLDATLGTSQFARLGQQVGARAYSPSFESEADYMGLYSVALAGYDVAAAPYFWRRMATLDEDSITLTTSHPPTAERFVALGKTVKEIQDKQAQKLPLFPNKRAK